MGTTPPMTRTTPVTPALLPAQVRQRDGTRQSDPPPYRPLRPHRREAGARAAPPPPQPAPWHTNATDGPHGGRTAPSEVGGRPLTSPAVALPTGHAGQGDRGGPPHPHARARSTWVADPNSPPSGRAVGGGGAPDFRRPPQQWKAPPPGTPFRHPHNPKYAIPRGLCVPGARSGCHSGSPRVPFGCVCARAPAASAPPPLDGVACAPRAVPALGAGRAVPRGPCPSACPAPVPCSVWRAWGRAVWSRFPPTWRGLHPLWGLHAAGVVGGRPRGGVACHCCEGRLVSGAVPCPTARPLGRAAGVQRPVCSGCGRCGCGGPAPVPQRAPLRAGVARCGGGGGASPGGVPSTIVRGVCGQALPLPRLPADWAGCWGPPPTCCGRGCVGVGAQHCPLGLHALWGLRAAGVVVGRPRGGWPATVVRGVWCQALSLPRPSVLWGGQPLFCDPCVPGAVDAGLGAQHRPHSVHPCGPALLAVGVAEGRPRGGCLQLL